MASAAKEDVGDSGSAAGPLQATVGSECPICLGAVRKPAFVAYCMHQFCFSCICHWARGREDCPVCRQALEQVLHSVRGDDDYELFVVGLPARLRRRMAMDRARRRPQRRYDLRRRPSAEPLSPTSQPGDTGRSMGQGAAPEPSRAQPDPTARTCPEPTRRTGHGGQDHQTRRTGHGGQDHQTRRTGHGGQDHQTRRTGHGAPPDPRHGGQ